MTIIIAIKLIIILIKHNFEQINTIQCANIQDNSQIVTNKIWLSKSLTD